MKVAILSMQHVQNFGSLLQSYSLKKILENLGHTVCFMVPQKNELDNSLLAGDTVDYSNIEGEGNGVISKIKKIDKYFFNRINEKKILNSQNIEFDTFRNQYLYQKDVNGRPVDACVIGSDEVFNLLQPSKWGFTSQLFGNILEANIVITYAASCGSTKIENVPELVSERIKESYKHISAFSVRDINTKNFVNNLTDKKVDIHLDPVVIGNFDQEIESANFPTDVPKKYCLIYSYYNRINNPKEICAIKQFCKNNGFEIISLGAPQMWIKKHIVCSPFEALRIFKNANFVITDTFHGTIFSAKYSKFFAVISRESNKNKVFDLVERLQITDHLVKDLDEIENQLSSSHDKRIISEISEQEKERALRYLRDNLTY